LRRFSIQVCAQTIYGLFDCLSTTGMCRPTLCAGYHSVAAFIGTGYLRNDNATCCPTYESRQFCADRNRWLDVYVGSILRLPCRSRPVIFDSGF